MELSESDASRALLAAAYYQRLIKQGAPSQLAEQLVRDWHAHQLAPLRPPSLSIDEALQATIRSAINGRFLP